MKTPIIVGICGPSAAGKTFLANYIKEYYKDKVSIVSYENSNYYAPFGEKGGKNENIFISQSVKKHATEIFCFYKM